MSGNRIVSYKIFPEFPDVACCSSMLCFAVQCSAAQYTL